MTAAIGKWNPEVKSRFEAGFMLINSKKQQRWAAKNFDSLEVGNHWKNHRESLVMKSSGEKLDKFEPAIFSLYEIVSFSGLCHVCF